MSTRWLEPDMARRFAEVGFGPVEMGGRPVHPMLRLPARAGDVVSVEWRSAASPRVQGLAARVRAPGVPGAKGRAGTLRVGTAESPSISLWMDTAPNPSTFAIVKARAGAELQISNRWRMPDGREDEWFQNYGMLIEDLSDDRYVLRCSDGAHPAGPDFDDLVVIVSRMSRDVNRR